jgi:hypothetical protein
MTLVSDKPAANSLVTAAIPALPLPPEVEFILSALEAGRHHGETRRKRERTLYHVTASLKLFSDTAQVPPWCVYVRDIDQRGLGFVTRHRLPLGYGGILTIPTPHGKVVKIDCTLLRCREAVQGWFEGGMYFNRPQIAFAPESLKPADPTRKA